MSKYARRKPVQFQISDEVATEQVVDLLEYYDIDVEAIPEGESQLAFERSLDSLTNYIRIGTLEVLRDAQQRVSVVQHLSGGDTVTYGELGAKHKLAMDRVKRDETYRRIYALMGSLCGLGSGAIEKMPARDLSVVEVLGMVFSNA